MEIQQPKDVIERPERLLPKEVEQAEANLRSLDRSASNDLARPEPTGIEKSMAQQIQEGKNAVESSPEFKPENWQHLGDAQRLQACQNLENRMAQIQERPPVKIVAEAMDRGCFGYYSRADGQMHVSYEHLRSNNTAEIQDTIVHEGRHAYQHYAVSHPGFHGDEAQVAAWRDNFQPGHYLRAEVVGFRAYVRQPVEADAWGYARQIVRR